MPEGGPWDDLTIPDSETAINARRVAETIRWDFYWGRDSERRYLLLLRHSPPSSPREVLPRLKGVDVFVQPGEVTARPSLILRLLDSTLRDIFLRLCYDIIETTSRATVEEQAVSSAVSRMWRWHHLLRGGGAGLLTLEEQLGLMGELVVLERYCLPALRSAAALAAWIGPLGAARDFAAGRTVVESKAVGAASSQQVMISSEHQLDTHDCQHLFLHLSQFREAEGEQEGFTVTDMTVRIKDQLRPGGSEGCERFDALLMAAGFRYEDDYSGSRWTGGERGIYEVRDSFPRLTPDNLPAGISHVRYMLRLERCAEFLVSRASLETALTGVNGG